MENLGLFGLLPGELRNQIYDLSLTHEPGTKASSALLSTCKQIHREAEAILYDNSTFFLNLELDDFWVTVKGDVNGRYKEHFGHAFHPPVGGRNPEKSPRCPNKSKNKKKIKSGKKFKKELKTQTADQPKTLFPAWAWRVKRFAITISGYEGLRAVNYFLLQMFHFLNHECSAVKEVYISLRSWETEFLWSHGSWIDYLYPIAKLPQHVTLILETEGLDHRIREGVLAQRARRDAEATRGLQFDPFRELQQMKGNFKSILGFGKLFEARERPWLGYLYDVGWELWDMIGGTFPLTALSNLGVYHESCDHDIMVYASTLKEILQVLKGQPDEVSLTLHLGVAMVKAYTF